MELLNTTFKELAAARQKNAAAKLKDLQATLADAQDAELHHCSDDVPTPDAVAWAAEAFE